MALPEPVWSDDDIKVTEEVIRDPSSLISSTWSKDPTKLAILRALNSCQARLGDSDVEFGLYIMAVMAQKNVCSFIPIHWKWRKYITKLFSGPFWSP